MLIAELHPQLIISCWISKEETKVGGWILGGCCHQHYHSLIRWPHSPASGLPWWLDHRVTTPANVTSCFGSPAIPPPPPHWKQKPEVTSQCRDVIALGQWASRSRQVHLLGGGSWLGGSQVQLPTRGHNPKIEDHCFKQWKWLVSKVKYSEWWYNMV